MLTSSMLLEKECSCVRYSSLIFSKLLIGFNLNQVMAKNMLKHSFT